MANFVFREDTTIRGSVAERDSLNTLNTQLVTILLSSKLWCDMGTKERNMCIRHFVGKSESEKELQEHLDMNGADDVVVSWIDVDPDNKTDIETRTMVEALGGMVSKSGAVVEVDIPDSCY